MLPIQICTCLVGLTIHFGLSLAAPIVSNGNLVAAVARAEELSVLVPRQDLIEYTAKEAGDTQPRPRQGMTEYNAEESSDE